MKEEWLRIGEIADFFGVSQKAVRLYEKKGIIKPVHVDAESGYRYYSTAQVQQLNALIELQSMGFSLDEIKDILQGEMSADKLNLLLDHKKTAWQEQLLAVSSKIDAIEGVLSRLQSSKEVKKLPELTEDERAWLLVKMVCVEDLRTQHIISEALWL